MKYQDIDPKIKRLFPWGLFLAAAALLLLATCARAYAEKDVFECYGPARYQAMSSAWPPCNEICGQLKGYLQTHTEAEARAAAIEKHIPAWIVKRAERCIR